MNFSASATGGTGTLTYSWSFGDGGSASGASVTHVYAATGTFTATVTVTDTASDSTSGTVQETINNSGGGVVVGVGPDDDGDGFSNTTEEVMGSDPEDPNSVPLGVTNVKAPLPLQVNFLTTEIHFKHVAIDHIRGTGLLPLPANFIAAGVHVGVDVGGVSFLGILNANGYAAREFRVQVKKSSSAQMAPFTITFNRGTFAEILAVSGLVNADIRRRATSLKVSILINKTLYQTNMPQIYSAIVDRLGVSR